MLKIPFQKNLEFPAEPLGRMDNFSWDGDIRPNAAFYLVHNGEALKVRLTADIKAPTVLCLQNDGEVWKDNCLEFFIKPFADHPDYLNIECNALGYFLIGKGPDRDDRTSVTATLQPHLGLTATIKNGESITVEYTLPFAALSTLYGKEFDPKAELRMNVYTCCETAPQVHFGAWSRIENPTPEFHLPVFFGKGVLCDGSL